MLTRHIFINAHKTYNIIYISYNSTHSHKTYRNMLTRQMLTTLMRTKINAHSYWLFSRDVIKSCKSAIFVPLETDAKRAVR